MLVPKRDPFFKYLSIFSPWCMYWNWILHEHNSSKIILLEHNLEHKRSSQWVVRQSIIASFSSITHPNLLKKNPELAEKYQNVVDDYVTKGDNRKMTPEEAEIVNYKTWFLPHHAVLNPNKPGKDRVVFDAASKFVSDSLNDHFLTGSDLFKKSGENPHEIS